MITGGGVIHDMRCDGIAGHGVHDVAARDFKTRITVVARYENGVQTLRPVGLRPRLMGLLRGGRIEVTRLRDGADMLWSYVGFAARLRRIGGPEAAPPAA